MLQMMWKMDDMAPVVSSQPNRPHLRPTSVLAMPFWLRWTPDWPCAFGCNFSLYHVSHSLSWATTLTIVHLMECWPLSYRPMPPAPPSHLRFSLNHQPMPRGVQSALQRFQPVSTFYRSSSASTSAAAQGQLSVQKYCPVLPTPVGRLQQPPPLFTMLPYWGPQSGEERKLEGKTKGM